MGNDNGNMKLIDRGVSCFGSCRFIEECATNTSRRMLESKGQFLTVVLLVLVLATQEPSAAAGIGSGAVLVAVGAQQRTHDNLSQGDVRPLSHGEIGGRLELDYLLGDTWQIAVSGHIGGAGFDFNGPLVSGRIRDQAWSARLGIERLVPIGTKHHALVGLGADYGEGRSWLDNLVMSDEGPHSFTWGGSAMLGFATSIAPRCYAYAQLIQGVHQAHAKDPPLGTKYNWVGRSLSGVIGLKFVILRGRQRNGQT